MRESEGRKFFGEPQVQLPSGGPSEDEEPPEADDIFSK